MGDYISLMDSLVLALVSMVAVFLILILISILISGLKNLDNEKKEEKVVKVEVEPAPAAENLTSNIVEEEKNEINEELVAVIAAAVASSLGLNIPDINIRSIRRVSQTNSSWGATGIKEQVSARLN